MKICKSLCVIFVLLSATAWAADDFQSWRPYREYLQLPEKYQSKAVVDILRKAFVAEKAVRTTPCKTGRTVEQELDKVASEYGTEDFDWKTEEADDGGMIVERKMSSLLNRDLVYRFHVDESGRVKPVNAKAEELME